MITDTILRTRWATPFVRLWLRRRLFTSVEVEPNSACTLRCRLCPNRAEPREAAFMPTELWDKILSDLAALRYCGTLSPHFFNEPLLDDRLPDLLGRARRALPTARLVLFSNFTLMTPALYQTLHPLVHEFVVSIDEPAIARAVEDFLPQIEPSLRDKIRTRNMRKEGILSNRGGNLDVDGPGFRPRARCLDPLRYLIIDYAGNVHFCFHDFHNEMIFGNVALTSIRDLWFSKDFLAARGAAFQGRYTQPLCGKCAWTQD